MLILAVFPQGLGWFGGAKPAPAFPATTRRFGAARGNGARAGTWRLQGTAGPELRSMDGPEQEADSAGKAGKAGKADTPLAHLCILSWKSPTALVSPLRHKLCQQQGPQLLSTCSSKIKILL